MTIKNGSVVYASNQVSSNANMRGTLIVDNATYVGKTPSEYSGVNEIGTLILKNAADVTLDKISYTNVFKDTTSKLSYNKLNANAAIYELDTYAFSLTADKTVLKADESLNWTVSIDRA